jgi:RNA polymerase sigma-70 factor (ECF subfamily)
MAAVTVDCPPAWSDASLLERAAGGDRSALDELFSRYRQPAYRVAFRLLGNEADALDAVQDGFVKALTHLPGFQGRSSFKTWLLRVVSNAALDLGRSRGRHEARSLEAVRHRELGAGQIARAEPADRALHQADARRLIDAALRELPDSQRQTFVLHADAGLSYREVAEAMEISVGTVMSRLFYARQKLRALLNESDLL